MMVANREGFAAVARRRLPYDAEVEYLQSSGTQYIDTGYVPYGRTPVITFRLYSIGTQSNVSMFGARNPTIVSGQRPSLWLTAGSKAWAWMMGVTYAGTATLTELANAWHTFKFDTPNLRVLVDGSRPDTARFDAKFPNGRLFLFATNETSWRAPFTGRISSFKIEDERGVVMDMIPVRKGTTGEMYDKVSGTFAMRVGTFTVGPDKTA